MSHARRSWHPLVTNLAIAATYGLLGFGLLMVAQLGVASPMWPPAGVAFAVVLRWRAKVIPGIVLGSIAANLAFFAIKGSVTGSTLVTATAIGVGAALQALLGAALVRKYVDRRPALSKTSDILLFLLLAGPVASVVNATIGTATQVATGVIPPSRAALAWLIWWAGDAMGVIVFGPITMMLLPDQRGLWKGWRLRVALPSAVFATVLMVAITASADAAQDRLETERSQVAQDANASLVNQLDRQQEVLQGIKALQLSTESVDAKEFRTYTREPLRRFNSLKALSWNPSLSSDELPAFVQARRQQPGGAGFTVTARNAQGDLEPVAKGLPQYVVVEYIEPLAANREALGYDIASNPARAGTIIRAQTTGEMTATPPIDLVQSGGDTQKGMLVLNPVYRTDRTPATVEERRAQLQGFSVGVYQLDDMLDEVFSQQAGGTRWENFNLQLVDVTDPSAPVTLATRDTAGGKQGAAQIVAPPIEINGRTWQLTLSPTSGPFAAASTGISPFLLLISMVVLYLLEALLLLLTAREREARKEAEHRSYEANHDALTGLVNRRGFISRLESLSNSSRTDPGTHVLLFCDLDRFKQVNDVAGHVTGDDLLVGIAGAMQSKVRESDVLARIGGDEFAVILIDCPLERGLQIANSVSAAVSDYRLVTDKGDFGVGVSIGATRLGGGEAFDPDVVIHEADAAAYAAKQGGTGEVVVFTDVMDVRSGDPAERVTRS